MNPSISLKNVKSRSSTATIGLSRSWSIDTVNEAVKLGQLCDGCPNETANCTLSATRRTLQILTFMISFSLEESAAAEGYRALVSKTWIDFTFTLTKAANLISTAFYIHWTSTESYPTWGIIMITLRLSPVGSLRAKGTEL